MTANLEAPVLVFHSGPRPAGVDERNARDRLRAGIEALLAKADDTGTCPAMEFHPSMFVGTLADYRAIARDFPKLSLTLDVGHLRCTDERPLAEGILDAAGETAHVHLEDIRGRVHKHLPVGEGDLPFGEVFGALRQSGFAGICAAEFHSREIDREEAALARDTFRRLAPLLHEER